MVHVLGSLSVVLHQIGPILGTMSPILNGIPGFQGIAHQLLTLYDTLEANGGLVTSMRDLTNLLEKTLYGQFDDGAAMCPAGTRG